MCSCAGFTMDDRAVFPLQLVVVGRVYAAGDAHLALKTKQQNSSPAAVLWNMNRKALQFY